jgi:hypothetical protein
VVENSTSLGRMSITLLRAWIADPVEGIMSGVTLFFFGVILVYLILRDEMRRYR